MFTTGRVAVILTREGLHATPARLRYAIARGHIPEVPVCASGFYQWDDDHVEAARRYCAVPAKVGRPRIVNVEASDA